MSNHLAQALWVTALTAVSLLIGFKPQRFSGAAYGRHSQGGQGSEPAGATPFGPLPRRRALAYHGFHINQCTDMDLMRWNTQKSAQVPVAKKLSHFRHRLDALGIEAVALRSHVQSHRRGSEGSYEGERF